MNSGESNKNLQFNKKGSQFNTTELQWLSPRSKKRGAKVIPQSCEGCLREVKKREREKRV